MRKRLWALSLAGMLALVAVQPANAAIHELVASFCSGGAGNVDPGGQIRFGTQSFLRALQATAIYDIQFGVVPAGQPAPAPGTAPVTVEIDYDHPASKFSDASGYFVFIDPEAGLTVYLDAGFPDHPAFEHCAALSGEG